MRRREFIGFVGGAAAWPGVARAQQAKVPVIGLLSGGTQNADASYISAFRKGLGEAGFVEGRNVAFEYRWAEGRNDRLSALVDDLVRAQVDAIITLGPYPLGARGEGGQ